MWHGVCFCHAASLPVQGNLTEKAAADAAALAAAAAAMAALAASIASGPWAAWPAKAGGRGCPAKAKGWPAKAKGWPAKAAAHAVWTVCDGLSDLSSCCLSAGGATCEGERGDPLDA